MFINTVEQEYSSIPEGLPDLLILESNYNRSECNPINRLMEASAQHPSSCLSQV